jgi:glycosyltransferase involved in cell wall biosynthesis
MRIVLLHYAPSGANPVYSELAAAMRIRGHQVYVAQAGADGSLVYKTDGGAEMQVPGPGLVRAPWSRIPVISSLLHRWQLLRFIGRVRRSLASILPDIVQINPLHMAELIPPFMPSRMHFILDVRQINEAVDARFTTKVKEYLAIVRRKIWARYVYEKTCFCHREAARRILGDSWQKWAEVVPVGVDEAFIDQPVEAKGNSSDKVSLVYVGTLSRLRNLENILHAARLLRMKSDRFQIDLIGPDKSNGYYPGVVTELDIESCVAIKPAIPYSTVPAVLASYDVGLAYTPDRPTWHYQPTIKVLEYRALGLPIISTDVASHRQVVENNVNGILCSDDPQAIADAMFRFVGSPDFLQQVKINASNMRTGCSWLDIADMYVNNVYLKLQGKASAEHL